MKKWSILAIVAVFISLLMCNSALKAQEEVVASTEQAVYSGPTQFVVEDPTQGPNIYVQYNVVEPLPVWFVRPYGWEILTPELAATAIIAAIFPFYYNWDIGTVYFREATFIHPRFHGRMDHFRNFNRRIGRGFNSHIQRIARGKPRFDSKMAKKSMPGKGSPPVGKFTPSALPKDAPAAHKPPPPKAGMATGKSGPPPKGLAPEIRKSPPPPKAGGPGSGLGMGGQIRQQQPGGVAKQPKGAPPRVAAPRPCPPPSKPAPAAKTAPQKKPPNQK